MKILILISQFVDKVEIVLKSQQIGPEKLKCNITLVFSKNYLIPFLIKYVGLFQKGTHITILKWRRLVTRYILYY